MARAQADLRYGRIIYAWIEDRNGFGKLRPAVVITPDELIDLSTFVVVAAVTTTFRSPPPFNHLPRPWHPAGSALTRLRTRSAVVIDWNSPVYPKEIIGFGGQVPATIMAELERRTKILNRQLLGDD